MQVNTSSPPKPSTSAGARARGRPTIKNVPEQQSCREKTICAVCHITSDNHHIHYGALACFSCRAFFRRAHSKGIEDPGYTCKKDNNCDITEKNRKKCQKCRYEKCLTAGMKPTQVLNAEQKKVRFRKMLEKKGSINFSRKRATTSQNQGEDDSGGSADDQDGEHESKCTKKTKAISRCSSDIGPKNWGESSSRSIVSMHSQYSAASSFSSPEASHRSTGHIISRSFSDSGISQNLYNEKSIRDDIMTDLENYNYSFGSNSLNPQEFKDLMESQFSASSSSKNENFLPSPQFLSSPLSWRGFQSHSSYLDTSTSQTSSTNNYARNKLSALIDSISTNEMSKNISLQHVCNIIQASEAGRSTNKEEMVSKKLVGHHQGDEDSIDKKTYLKELILYLCSKFRYFANNFQPFMRLSMDDRKALIVANAPLYLHFVISQYLSSKTGKEQLKWVLPNEFTSCLPQDLARFPMDEVIFSEDYFNKKVMEVFNYSELSAEIAQLTLNPDEMSVIMALTLFAPRENANVENTSHVTKTLETLMHCIEDTCALLPLEINRGKCDKLFDLLHVMNNFCPSQIFTEHVITPESPTIKSEDFECQLESGTCSMPSASYNEGTCYLAPFKPMDLKYTIEEEKWIAHQVEKFHEAYRKVSLGEDLVNEFVMFTYDVPLSKHYIPSEITTFLERCRCVMKMHPEFESLSDDEQREVWKESSFKAVALYSVKAETFSTGLEQLQFCLGWQDQNEFEKNFAPNIHNKLKKVLVTDWNRTSNAMNSDVLLNYLQLTAKLSTSLEEFEMFIIITLMFIFKGNHARSISLLAELEEKYSNVFRRRLASRGDKSSMLKIKSGLESLEELAEIFKGLHIF